WLLFIPRKGKPVASRCKKGACPLFRAPMQVVRKWGQAPFSMPDLRDNTAGKKEPVPIFSLPRLHEPVRRHRAARAEALRLFELHLHPQLRARAANRRLDRCF